MPVVYFLNRLRPGITPDDYEQWVRDVDYPTAHSLNTIKSYVVAKMEATLDGNPPPYDFVERVAITDVDEYRKELSGSDLEEFAKEWASYAGESVSVYGEEIS